MINYIVGNLFDEIKSHSKVVIPHVCNDVRAWGSGFVVPLGDAYPEAKEKYLNLPDCNMTLGYVSWDIGNDVSIANMIAQRSTIREEGNTRPLNYGSLVKCMDQVRQYIECDSRLDGAKIIAPKFGSELAGGNWTFIEELIKDIWIDAGIEVNVCVLNERDLPLHALDSSVL